MIEQSPRRGWRLGTVGWLAVTLGSVCLGFFVKGAPAEEQWAQRAAGLVLVMAGVWAVLRGRRHLTQVLADLRLLSAGERIVLFLRAFSDDRGFSRVNARRALLSGSVVTPADVRTEEDQVARAVAPFGRMVALGNPRDRLPILGADRSYASDETWKGQVLAALDRADLVVLAAGAGGGLAWEVDQVVHRDPTRLVLVVSRDRRQYTQFRESFAGRFPRGLPEYAVRIRQRILRGRYVRAVIWFDADWTPHLKLLDGRFLLIGSRRRTLRALRRVLRPVYQRAGVPARITPTMARPWAVKLSIALIVMFWLTPVILLSLAIGSIRGDSNSLPYVASPPTAGAASSGTGSLIDIPCSPTDDSNCSLIDNPCSLTGHPNCSLIDSPCLLTGDPNCDFFCHAVGSGSTECQLVAGNNGTSCLFTTVDGVATCSFTIDNQLVICLPSTAGFANCASTTADSGTTRLPTTGSANSGTVDPPTTGPGSHPSGDGSISFLLVWSLLIAGLLAPWMYRVWRGGPVAITMARIQGLSFPVFLLALVVSLISSPHALLALGFLIVGSAALAAYSHLLWLLCLSLALLVLGMLGMLATTLLLVRREVREWIDSRL